MNLFVLRHASAGTRRTNPAVDVKRPLDKDGKRHCLHLANVLNTLTINFDLIVSSPLKRSLQTAQLVGTETGYETPILISNALAPTATWAQFQRLLHECSSYENVLVVGHNPNITSFVMQLVCGANGHDGARERTRIRLRKGSIARFNMQRGPATLLWLLDPRVVKALYASSTKSSRRKTSRK
ncbi:MAG TPA: histidine phosphatase family protein [Candidatus Aquilonibacter sp.]|nr:histidine phosphatase family protein [Candidatus Aquilonibacter sp.]